MGFKEDKVNILKALKSGMVLHEDRTDQESKNMVDSGEVSLDLACKIVEATPGLKAKSSSHHRYQSITIWILTPKLAETQWYVKCYLIDEDLWILSFHN